MLCDFQNFVWLIPKTNYCRTNIFQGTLVPLYQDNSKLGHSDKRRKNYPDDNDPEKVKKLNMKYGLVLNSAIYMLMDANQNENIELYSILFVCSEMFVLHYCFVVLFRVKPIFYLGYKIERGSGKMDGNSKEWSNNIWGCQRVCRA